MQFRHRWLKIHLRQWYLLLCWTLGTPTSVVHVSRKAFLSEGFALCQTVGRRVETTWTWKPLWCQWFAAGRLHSKSHCVFSSLHLETGCFSFFHALVHLWTGNVWKNMSNMVMCSLNLWMAKRRLQLVHYIMSNSSVPFLWASTSIYKFRSTTGERGEKNLHLICSLASGHQCFSSSLPLIKAAEETCLFFPLSL